MAATTTPSPLDISAAIDDEIAALKLQLKDIDRHEETKKGKYTATNVPDLEIAYTSYLTEIRTKLQLLEDSRLAHSIANAVSQDANAIAELVQAEAQAQQDRQTALQLDSQDPNANSPPPPYTKLPHGASAGDNIQYLVPSEHLDVSDSDVAGPSQPYMRHQFTMLEKSAQKNFQCTACTGSFRIVDITTLECQHDFCRDCLRNFILQGVKEHDLALLPPRCCSQRVPPEVIVGILNDHEMELFQEGETERNTRDKTYCCDAECGRFISQAHILGSKATCRHCGTQSCAMCKQAFHEDDCPSDSALQATLDLGNQLNWRRCFSCHAMVSIEMGCNHMTCRCGSEFCYGCGEEWTNPRRCACDFWTEDNLLRRAEQVVDRAASPDIRPAERQLRIARVQEQLRDTDECNHRGRRKFERIQGGYGVPTFTCEMCNRKHRQFILRCRQCQLDVCVSCRLHRV